ncbi:MAG: PIN domain-containing protein [Acidobacteriota bacterium]|nr:PIN domain-containing protein [Acidobacteriota bacterium]
MNGLFVDTIHLVALVNPRDQWHQKAVEIETATRNVDLVTTEDILTEFLNFYSEHGEFMRLKVAAFVREILLDVRVKIIPRNETTFLNALELYESRLDKGYSLTDCISMNVCRNLGITKILTHDRHFEQEGFTILL